MILNRFCLWILLSLGQVAHFAIAVIRYCPHFFEFARFRSTPLYAKSSRQSATSRYSIVKLENLCIDLCRLGLPTLQNILKIGMTGFEPATPSSRTKCATKLRYIPIFLIITPTNKKTKLIFIFAQYIQLLPLTNRYSAERKIFYRTFFGHNRGYCHPRNLHCTVLT